MSFPRYPAYKDSGVEWLGDVPEHWEVLPLRRILSEVNSGASVNAVDEPAIPGQAGVLKTSCVYTGEFRPDENKAILDSELVRASCPVEQGSLIVSRMNTPDLVGAAGLVKHDAPDLYLPDRLWQVRFRDCVPSYLHYWTKSIAYRAEVQVACSGTSSSMQNLSQENFSSFRSPLPPEGEQAAIATFLDHETAKIDALIAEQQWLIELLQEKRQAVISHAVTKGLNPDALMKDSGVEWLGEVPEHWEVKPLKYLMMLTSGGTPSKENLAYWDGSVPWASSKDLKADDLFDTQDHISQKALDDGAAALVPTGSILTVVRGMILLHTFPVVFTHVPMAINQDLKAILPTNGIASGYLAWLLRGASGEVLGRVDEAGHGTKVLRIDSWLAVHVPVPPTIEQELIVADLVKRLQEIVALTDQAQRAVCLLQERRSALISAAVTGQIDVRGVVPAKVAA